MTAVDITTAEHSRQLVARFQGGDPDAFAEIYRQHRDAIFAFLLGRCRDRDLADDLTQTVFVRAWDGLTRWEWQGKNVVAYLMTIAANLLHDHRKSLRQRMTADNPAAIDYALNAAADDSRDGHPDEQAISRALSAEVIAAMRQLTEDQRTCLWLRFIVGLRVNETAAVMGRHRQAIQSMTFRATRAAARHLDRTVNRA